MSLSYEELAEKHSKEFKYEKSEEDQEELFKQKIKEL